MKILGVRIDPISPDQIPELITEFLMGDSQHIIATPNPEMVVLANRDASFLEILNRTSLNIADGTGLLLAARFNDIAIPARITGIDMVHSLVERAVGLQKRIYFLGGKHETIAEHAANHFRAAFPEAAIATDFGGPIRHTEKGEWSMDPAVIQRVQEAAPDVLIVALGHGKQERFIGDHLAKFPTVKIAIGVGGALDVYAGIVPRAPRLLQKFGLEWLWRLMREPKRLPRILTAVCVFPVLVVLNKFKERPS
ncbi:MAG: WecB/TagA/CpsF family glycosyltransferase [bacterium]|nr:WecB/TagA/CpsF family glycosyltransferase [bacterium]